jgi:hypothetical protein
MSIVLPDDTAGVCNFYGARFYYPPGELLWRIGYPITLDFYPNNDPTSFSATGFPPGMSINQKSGRLNGTPTASGVHFAIITAHGPIVDVSEGYKFNILGVEDVPGLVAIVPSYAYTITGNPVRPRIYAIGPDGVGMIDTETFKITQVTSEPVYNPRSSMSADQSTLLYTDYFEVPAKEHRNRPRRRTKAVTA